MDYYNKKITYKESIFSTNDISVEVIMGHRIYIRGYIQKENSTKSRYGNVCFPVDDILEVKACAFKKENAVSIYGVNDENEKCTVYLPQYSKDEIVQVIESVKEAKEKQDAEEKERNRLFEERKRQEELAKIEKEHTSEHDEYKNLDLWSLKYELKILEGRVQAKQERISELKRRKEEAEIEGMCTLQYERQQELYRKVRLLSDEIDIEHKEECEIWNKISLLQPVIAQKEQRKRMEEEWKRRDEEKNEEQRQRELKQQVANETRNEIIACVLLFIAGSCGGVGIFLCWLGGIFLIPCIVGLVLSILALLIANEDRCFLMIVPVINVIGIFLNYVMQMTIDSLLR